MMKTIEHLLKNSGLPGPRGNLELLYSFSKNATKEEIDECLSYYKDNLHDSPEEFVVMCGIVGYCIRNKDNIQNALNVIRQFATHSSWRIREAVAIGIQEITENHTNEIMNTLEKWANGNDLEKRAVVAALCEPKLLKEKSFIIKIFDILTKITMSFDKIEGKLTESQNSLRKTLGYGWSVAIASLPYEGKEAFESIARCSNKHIKWIVRENLKKKRLTVMDKKWVEKMLSTFV